MTLFSRFLFLGAFMIVTFCGHSQYTATGVDEQKILSLLTERGGDRPAELYLGGYFSFDTFACKCGKKYRETNPNTKLIFVTPYITESYQKNHLNDEKDRYDTILYPPLERVPPRYAISCRNRWMVEQAELVVAYVKHEWGGAYQTYTYARKKKKEIFNLAE